MCVRVCVRACVRACVRVCVQYKDEEESCAYWELTVMVCDLIGVHCDGVVELLNNAGLNSLGSYLLLCPPRPR